MEKKGETKRQHYVPRSILRRFSEDGKNTSIVTVTNGNVYPRGPIKNQCYEDYFYGEDLTLEKSLAEMEARVGHILGALDPSKLERASDDDCYDLKQFMHYQKARTRGAVEQLKATICAIMRGVAELDAEKRGKPKPLAAELASIQAPPSYEGPLESLLCAMRTTPVVSDLALKFVLTDRTPGFLVGDHPVVVCNQFAESHRHLSQYPVITGGLVKGIQMIMPVAPRVALMAYDGDVYDVDGRGRVCRAGPRDVGYINAMQFVSAWECAFFDGRRMTAEALEQYTKLREKHPRVHLSDCTTNVYEQAAIDGKAVTCPSRDFIVTAARDIRVGARFSFLRVKDTTSYKLHQGPTVPIRSIYLCNFAEQYGQFVQKQIDQWFAQNCEERSPE